MTVSLLLSVHYFTAYLHLQLTKEFIPNPRPVLDFFCVDDNAVDAFYQSCLVVDAFCFPEFVKEQTEAVSLLLCDLDNI